MLGRLKQTLRRAGRKEGNCCIEVEGWIGGGVERWRKVTRGVVRG